MTTADGRHTAFRQLLSGPKLEFAMEAHSALSALVAERCGFKCLWGSGLTISSSLGLRDSNEASWSDSLDVLEFITDAADIPLLFDGDTGFGNFNNFRLLVRKLGQRGVSGVTLEDKVFPKMNSFVGDRHPLADIDEMCGKIKAGKDSQAFDNFAIVARTEALIAKRGIPEALHRAEAYRRAGADAIFIHSRLNDASEVFEFARRWERRCPLVVAPTTYYQTDVNSLEEAGVTIFICANHSLRAAIAAMAVVGRRILSDRSLREIEPQVAPLKEIFSLIDYDELLQAEGRYLPPAIEAQFSDSAVGARPCGDVDEVAFGRRRASASTQAK